jgi:hypothetical protein
MPAVFFLPCELGTASDETGTGEQRQKEKNDDVRKMEKQRMAKRSRNPPPNQVPSIALVP